MLVSQCFLSRPWLSQINDFELVFVNSMYFSPIAWQQFYFITETLKYGKFFCCLRDSLSTFYKLLPCVGLRKLSWPPFAESIWFRVSRKFAEHLCHDNLIEFAVVNKEGNRIFKSFACLFQSTVWPKYSCSVCQCSLEQRNRSLPWRGVKKK